MTTRQVLPALDVVIVNWNSGAQLRECLESLAGAVRGAFSLSKVTVVDNGSTDGSAGGLDVPGLPVTLIANPGNLGFAAACNQGARGSTGDYLLFLNPDARVLPDSIDRAIGLMEAPDHARTGICGIQLVDADGRVSRTCARLPTPRLLLTHALGLDRLWPARFPGHVMAEWDHGESRPVDHVIGAFYLVRRPLFDTLRGFDERFFVYLEDLDFSSRARQEGYRCFYLAEARAFHKGGGTSDQVRAVRLFYAIRSRIQYAYKHFGWLAATAVMIASRVVEPGVRLGFAALRGAGGDFVETLQAYALLWRRGMGGAAPGEPRPSAGGKGERRAAR